MFVGLALAAALAADPGPATESAPSTAPAPPTAPAPSTEPAPATAPTPAPATAPTPPPRPIKKPAFGFSRVDILSEDPGFWINDELPNILAYPLRPTLRFVMQVKVVWATPVRGLTLGTSISSQSVHYERTIFGFESVTMGAGLQTALLLPRGIWVDVAWHRGPYRLALGLSTISDASWANLRWDSWRFLPTVGVGIGLPNPPKVD